MSNPIGVRIDNEHEDALTRMVESGKADSTTEALRQTSQAELARRGYLTGNGHSALESALNTVGFVCGIIGIIWLATTLVYPVQLRLPALGFLLAGVVSFGLERAVGEYDAVATIRRLVGRGESA